jgi:hypothetical protein
VPILVVIVLAAVEGGRRHVLVGSDDGELAAEDGFIGSCTVSVEI